MPVSACSMAFPADRGGSRFRLLSLLRGRQNALHNSLLLHIFRGETMSKFDAQFAGRLDGQTVLVTGAKGGIGHETAQGIGNSGATVLVHARGAEQARRAAGLLVANGNGRGQYLAVAG